VSNAEGHRWPMAAIRNVAEPDYRKKKPYLTGKVSFWNEKYNI
jgi:hypothetical protein